MTVCVCVCLYSFVCEYSVSLFRKFCMHTWLYGRENLTVSDVYEKGRRRTVTELVFICFAS